MALNGLLGLLLFLSSGCEAHAELEVILPRVDDLAVLTAQLGEGVGRLELVLLDQEGRPLLAFDRMTKDRKTYWLSELQAQHFTLTELQLRDAEGAPVMQLDPAPRSVEYVPRPLPLHLALVLDNSAQAALIDPEQQRLVMSRALADAVFCAAGTASTPCLWTQSTISLLVLEGDQVTTAVERASTPETISTSLTTVATTTNGGAPVWDGLLAAAQLTRQAVETSTGGAPVILLYTSSAPSASSSHSDAAQVQAALGESPPIPLLAVTPATTSAELLSLITADHGALLHLNAQLTYPRAGRVALAALSGRWVLHMSLTLRQALSPGVYWLAGRIAFSLAADDQPRPFSVPLSITTR